MLPYWFCMRSYILHCTSTSSNVIYSTTQHGSDRHPIYKDSGKLWNKWWPAEKKIWKYIFCRKEWKNSHIPRWNRGLRIVIWTFHWYTYLMFFTPCPISVCMAYLRGRIREVGAVAGKGACVNACWCIHGANESGVHVMNGIVRKQWIYVCECSHPFCPAVPGCPQGHHAPPGPILGGSLGIPPLLLLWRRRLGCPGNRCSSHPPSPSRHVKQW